MTDLINLYQQAQDYFFRGITSKCMDLGDGANAYMTGRAELNFIYITRNTNDLDKILIQGKQFFDQDNLTFDVIIPQELCTPQMADVFNTMGYPQKSKSVSMAVDLDSFATDQTANFDSETTIKPNDDQLNDWIMPFIWRYLKKRRAKCRSWDRIICATFQKQYMTHKRWKREMRYGMMLKIQSSKTFQSKKISS